MEEKVERNIAKKTVIVTGGSRGIGVAIVKMFAQNNCNVVLNYNKSEENARKIKEELEQQGKNIEIFKADVSNRKDVQKLVKYTIEKFKSIDILVNNAGISQVKLFTDITDEDWEDMIKNNLNSVFYCTQEVLPTMINKKQGCIINISSVWGMVGGSCEVHYSAAKAGIDGMTKALAKELGPSNIRVNSIAPGIIDTDMNKNITENELENLKEEIPLGRIGYSKDIAKCVKWLSEDEYITGQVISINGGWVII